MKSFIYLLALIFGSLGIGAAAHSSKPVISIVDAEEANKEIAARLFNVMGSCANRIWPNYSWQNLNVVLIGPDSSKTQIALSVKQNRIFKVPTVDLPIAALKTSYAFFDLKDGSQWMSINTAQDIRERPHFSYADIVRDNVRFAIHEGFHRKGQTGWKIYEGNRGTAVPILAEPRLQRAMIFDHLRAALLFPDKKEEELRRARHWYDQWKNHYPDEVISTADGYEGSARYSDWIGFALSEFGCSASEKQVQAYIDSILPTHFGLSVGGEIFAFDFEGYEIGALAAFLLRRSENPGSWQQRLAASETPLSILMESVHPEAESAPEEKVMKFNDSAKRFQAEAIERIGSSIDLFKDPNAIFVSIPRNWYKGSFSPLSFYIDRATNVQLIPMAIPMRFERGSSSLESLAGAVFLSNLRPPCGADGDWQFVVGPSSVERIEPGSLKIFGTSYRGELKGQSQKAGDGRIWFCAGDH